MNTSVEIVLLLSSLLLALSIFISKTGYRFGVPTLLMFLVAGMALGTDGIGLEFDDVHTAQNIGMVALCVILFSGGMDTKIADIRPVAAPGIVLSTAGVLLTTALTGVFIYYLSGWEHRTGIGFGILSSMLLAATMSSTDSASVFNILRSQKIGLKHHLRPMLELESGSNDPMAYLLTILLIQCLGTDGSVGAWSIALSFVQQFAVGIAAGCGLGWCIVWIFNHIGLKNKELYPILCLCFIFVIYCVAYLLGGNGYLAVYIAGMVAGNCKMYMKHETGTFLGGLTWLVQVIMFLVLGLLVNPKEMLSIIPFAIPVGLFMMFAARPLSVWLSLLPFGRRVTSNSKWFISWVGLKGAAPIIFATYPVVAGVDGAGQIFNIVFFVTLVSLLLQGMTLPQASRLLHLNEPVSNDEGNFGVAIPDEIGSRLEELPVTSEMLSHGDRMPDLNLPKGKLAMLVKRNDGSYIVPDGRTTLATGDILLLISSEEG